MNDARKIIANLHILTYPAPPHDHDAIEAACRAYLSLCTSMRAPTMDALLPVDVEHLDEPLTASEQAAIDRAWETYKQAAQPCGPVNVDADGRGVVP